MATLETSELGPISVGSHLTALCIIPPEGLWAPVDRLRALYDKAYQKWPPHVNLIYPFVSPEALSRASDLVQSAVQSWRAETGSRPFPVCLDSTDVFHHRDENTIFICDQDKQRAELLQSLRRAVLEQLGQADGAYRMHMTVAQSEDVKSSTHNFLQDKVGLLPPLRWEVDKLHILVRERMQFDGLASSQMKVWGTVDLSTGEIARSERPVSFFNAPARQPSPSGELEGIVGERDQLQTRSSYKFSVDFGLWELDGEATTRAVKTSRELAISSYNVLAEFDWPPSQQRYPLIIQNILSDMAMADVLVLQEVTDNFLSYLLQDEAIRQAYPFVSHGPPDQKDVEPLPSFQNQVVLCKWAFDWEWVSCQRQHKGSVVVRFRDLGTWDDAEFTPVILATVHMSHGLTDGSVAAKKSEIERVFNYLSRAYPDSPWIIAGDFNMTTSSGTISSALKKGSITTQTAGYLASLERLLCSDDITDTWTIARCEVGEDESLGEGEVEGWEEDILEGEHGATYNPLVNTLVAKIVGSGRDNRPQRYDRILVRREGHLRTSKFNMFGFITGQPERADDVDSREMEPLFASDHWGVRCLLTLEPEASYQIPEGTANLVIPVHLKKAVSGLSDPTSVIDCLSDVQLVPTDEEVSARASAFNTLKEVLLESTTTPAPVDTVRHARLQIQPILVPVGSYGLGVWTSSSDMDCLCIGPFSTRTFFALATQRLRKAASKGVKILRKVRAASGTMLELEVQGLKMDLQYCPATGIVERWPEVLRLPASDPVWTLPTQTLGKLKAIRDLDYLRRSVPDIAQFRLAHRFVKTWAKSRGIYSAKFGFLGGIQISVLLARICKTLARDAGPVSVGDILTTFFNHYAHFDWRTHIAFDQFFHRQRLTYNRTAREPLAILGYFPPMLNTSHAASRPSVRTISEEFRRADDILLAGTDDTLTWSGFLASGGASDFLRAYKSYVKIDVQYWGVSLAKGSAFVGWLESRCAMLLVDIARRLPSLQARFWPARFVDSAVKPATGDEEEARDYQGCYLVGLDMLADIGPATMDKGKLRAALGALQTVLRRFEEQIRGDERYFDAAAEWMSASVVRQAELGELIIDTRDWGEYIIGDDEEDDEDEEEEEEGEEVEEAYTDNDDPSLVFSPDDYNTPSRYLRRRKGDDKKGAGTPTQKPTATASSPATGSSRLRTAADVLNRLRWDPGMDGGDYVVGWEDRFLGPREKTLETWRSEETDEEFIPQHRILYFKRRSDGAVVWDRRRRVDDIFGSGKSAARG